MTKSRKSTVYFAKRRWIVEECGGVEMLRMEDGPAVYGNGDGQAAIAARTMLKE